MAVDDQIIEKTYKIDKNHNVMIFLYDSNILILFVVFGYVCLQKIGVMGFCIAFFLFYLFLVATSSSNLQTCLHPIVPEIVVDRTNHSTHPNKGQLSSLSKHSVAAGF